MLIKQSPQTENDRFRSLTPCPPDEQPASAAVIKNPNNILFVLGTSLTQIPHTNCVTIPLTNTLTTDKNKLNQNTITPQQNTNTNTRARGQFKGIEGGEGGEREEQGQLYDQVRTGVAIALEQKEAGRGGQKELSQIASDS